MSATSSVFVVGDGLLAEFVATELSCELQVIRRPDLESGVPEGVDFALVVNDDSRSSVHDKAQALFQAARIPWLRACVSFGEAVVGPWVFPGIPGCVQCADMRRMMAGPHREEMSALHELMLDQAQVQRDPWASRTGLFQVAQLVVAQAELLLQGREVQLEGRVCLLDLKTLTTSRHFFLPDPLCHECGALPDDEQTAAVISLEPSPKVNADSYRCRSIDELKGVLVTDYLDSRTGLFNGSTQDLVPAFAIVSVNLPLLSGDEIAAGRTHSYTESELTAILEGLERYGGDAPRGKRTVIHESYCHLVGEAMNPLCVGTHSEKHYERPDFPFKPFDPNLQMDWVWGYSFLKERPILVPEVLAYMTSADTYVYETSNGCALGGSLMEAIFYGILEVVERDSFLLTWYANLPLPPLSLDSIDDEELQLMVHRVRAVAGYDLHFFNATMENGIPSVWALAKNRKQKGLNLICAAGAHPDPVRAMKGAIHELADMMMTRDQEFEQNRVEFERMLRDPYCVRRMAHHGMLYGLLEAEARFDFLLNNHHPYISLEEAFKPTTNHRDLTDDLRELLQVFRKLNLDVIVVDQTTAEMKRNALHCVKVLIPGMLPMTFGYCHTRLEGLHRVLNVPVMLGYRAQPLTREELNVHPHPFP